MVILPVDHLKEIWPAELKGVCLGALLHPASVNGRGVHVSQVLHELGGSVFQLKALFGPQHGYLGQTQDNMIEWKGYEHPQWRIPVYSLYGEHREPTDEMLSDIDCLLVDLQDVGARYYTFIWSMFLCMRACEKLGKSMIVCDRPNPIGSAVEEGSPLEEDHLSFVGLHALPIRHGKTIGEVARLFHKECFSKLELHVLEMENWNREMWYDQTGLPWVMPSPNMPSLETATVYPGMCLLEGTNVSEGRGTTRPFELFGAPFLDAEKLCANLNDQKIDGVFFREAHFQPTFQKWAGEVCHGVQIHIQDKEKVRSFDMAIRILHCLFHACPNDFEWKTPPYEYEFEKKPIDILLGNGWFREKYIENG